MCPHCYHHNSFVATRALVHVTYGYILLVPLNENRTRKAK